MPLIVGKLREELIGVDDNAGLYVLFEGKVRPVEDIAIVLTGTAVFLRGKGQPRQSKQFTAAEDGLIGSLIAKGASDSEIANLLERSEASIKSRRKKLGY